MDLLHSFVNEVTRSGDFPSNFHHLQESFHLDVVLSVISTIQTDTGIMSLNYPNGLNDDGDDHHHHDGSVGINDESNTARSLGKCGQIFISKKEREKEREREREREKYFVNYSFSFHSFSIRSSN